MKANNMKANRNWLVILALTAAVMMVVMAPSQLAAQSDAPKASSKKKSSEKKMSDGPKWSVQVEKVDPADIALGPSFQMAIYENLLTELAKKKQGKEKLFKQVLRSGDRSAASVPDLLIMKTTVRKFSEGSETKRAVTTVTGATKLNVKSQLCTRDGKVVVELMVEGDVHFFGSNLRATHNLAKNVASQIMATTIAELTPIPAGGE
jgi:hypothetical protein